MSEEAVSESSPLLLAAEDYSPQMEQSNSKGDENLKNRKNVHISDGSQGLTEDPSPPKKRNSKARRRPTSLLQSIKGAAKRIKTWSEMRKNLRQNENSFFHQTKKKREEKEKIRLIMLETENHWAILTSLHGSVWPSVLPFCIVEVLLTATLSYLKSQKVDLTYPAGGHHFLSLLVSFLVVTRVSITYSRFMELRHYLSKCFQHCRDLVQLTDILTLNSTSPEAIAWRRQVALKTTELLRVTIAAIEYKATKVASFDILPDVMKKGVDFFVDEEVDEGGSLRSSFNTFRHGQRTPIDENWRAPIVCAFNLRCEIMRTRTDQFLQKPLHVNEELKILGEVSGFVVAFHGLKRIITTPFPFPLIQMSRTLLFVWVFTLPFCIVNSIDNVWQSSMISFLICYGFVGLEYVSIEFEDPFGDDPNDFDAKSMAQLVYEDLFIIIFKTDGQESAQLLQELVSEKIQEGDAFKCYMNENALEAV